MHTLTHIKTIEIFCAHFSSKTVKTESQQQQNLFN